MPDTGLSSLPNFGLPGIPTSSTHSEVTLLERDQADELAEGLQRRRTTLWVTLAGLLAIGGLAGVGFWQRAAIIQVPFNVGDKVTYQGREMIVSKGKDRDGKIKMRPVTCDLSGVKAIADALCDCPSLTTVRWPPAHEPMASSP